MEGKEVLVLQHQSAHRGLLISYIQRLGLPALGAPDLVSARRTLAKGQIRVVVLDLLAGEVAEIREFTQQLTSEKRHIQLIVLTPVPEPNLIGLKNNDFPRSITYIWAQSTDALTKLAKALMDKYSRGSKAYCRDHLTSEHALKTLSNSQRDLLIGLASGYSNQKIARNRGTSVRAVEHLLKRTLSVLQLTTETQGNSRVMALRKYLQTIGGNPRLGSQKPEACG